MDTQKLKSDVGRRVRSYRVLHSYTQTDFAGKIGISVNFLSEIENGKKGMSQETLYRLCEYFGLSADYILFGKSAATSAAVGADTPASVPTPALAQVLKDTELKTLTDFLVSMRGVFSSGPS